MPGASYPCCFNRGCGYANFRLYPLLSRYGRLRPAVRPARQERSVRLAPLQHREKGQGAEANRPERPAARQGGLICLDLRTLRFSLPVIGREAQIAENGDE